MGGSESTNSSQNLPPDFPKDVVFYHLANLMNTCYCNSVLQAFLFSNNITDFFLRLSSIPFPKELTETPLFKFQQIFASKIQYIKQSSNNNISRDISIRPVQFLESIYHETSQFVRNQQNDSHEFLLYLISSFDNTIIKLKKIYSQKNDSQLQTDSNTDQKIDNIKSEESNNSGCVDYGSLPLFSTIFEGSRSSSFECAFCHQIQEKIEKFTYLDISIPLDNPTKELDIQKLIDYSLDPDNISSEDGGWVCSGCNKKGVNVEITSYIKDLPITLLIQLQRFKYSKSTNTMAKINRFIKIQNQIHLNSGMGPQKYELKAVICHIGGSLHEGHFITLLRVPKLKIECPQNSGDFWIYASDAKLSLIDQNKVDQLIKGNGNEGSITPYVLLFEIIN